MFVKSPKFESAHMDMPQCGRWIRHPFAFFVALHFVTNREGRGNAFLYRQTFFFVLNVGKMLLWFLLLPNPFGECFIHMSLSVNIRDRIDAREHDNINGRSNVKS